MNCNGKQILSIFATVIFMMIVFLQPIHQFAHNHVENHQELVHSNEEIPESQQENICFLCDFTLPATTEFIVATFEFNIQEDPLFLLESFQYLPFHTHSVQSEKQLRAPPFFA